MNKILPVVFLGIILMGAGCESTNNSTGLTSVGTSNFGSSTDLSSMNGVTGQPTISNTSPTATSGSKANKPKAKGAQPNIEPALIPSTTPLIPVPPQVVVHQPSVDNKKICSDIQTESENLKISLSQFISEFNVTRQLMTDTSSADTFKLWLHNWTSIYDEVNTNTNDLQNKAKSIYFPHADSIANSNLDTDLTNASIYLKGYYDANLESLRFSANTSWDDYGVVKSKELSNAASAELDHAMGAVLAAGTQSKNIQNSYSNLLTQYNCTK